MVGNVHIQIGEGDGAFYSLHEASDTWVRSRICELRAQGMDSRLKFSFEWMGQVYSLATPRSADLTLQQQTPLSQMEILLEITQLWEFSGLNSPHYTASAVIVFLRRFRKLFLGQSGMALT